MPTIRVMTIADVHNDQDLKDYYKYNRKMMTYLAREYAATAAELGAMLKAHDQRYGKKRRGKVVRPLALAAGVLVLVSRYITLSAKRFDVEYAPELDRAGRKKVAGSRTLNFDPED
jgi:hypothetical protein